MPNGSNVDLPGSAPTSELPLMAPMRPAWGCFGPSLALPSPLFAPLPTALYPSHRHQHPLVV